MNRQIAGPDRDAGTLTLTDKQIEFLRSRAQFVRLEAIRLIEIAKVGHYTSVFSCAEILAALFYNVMSLRRGEPQWSDRDRFLLGKGHAAVGLFPILADFDFITREVLDSYTRLGSPLGDHPDMTKVPGIDFSSGSLGHALSVGAGMAIGARRLNKDFRVFALLGDGEMQEGQVWEAALFAAHHGLGNLIAIVDRNGFQLDGRVDDVIGIEPLADKWRSFNWEVYEVDGHNIADLTGLLRQLRADGGRAKPACVIAQTIKGKGIPYMETEPGWHLGYLAPADARAAINHIKAQEG